MWPGLDTQDTGNTEVEGLIHQAHLTEPEPDSSLDTREYVLVSQRQANLLQPLPVPSSPT